MRYFPLSLLVAFSVLASPEIARANDIFSVTGDGNTISFSIPATPSAFAPTSYDFGINATVTDNGVTSADMLLFYTGSDGGTFADTHFGFSFVGPQLYTGSTSAPTFILGTFAATDGLPGSPNDVSINIAPSATPEPSTVALLGTGMLGAIVLARRRFRLQAL